MIPRHSLISLLLFSLVLLVQSDVNNRYDTPHDVQQASTNLNLVIPLLKSSSVCFVSALTVQIHSYLGTDVPTSYQGKWLAKIDVGTPPQTLSAVIDINTTLTWVVGFDIRFCIAPRKCYSSTLSSNCTVLPDLFSYLQNDSISTGNLVKETVGLGPILLKDSIIGQSDITALFMYEYDANAVLAIGFGEDPNEEAFSLWQSIQKLTSFKRRTILINMINSPSITLDPDDSIFPNDFISVDLIEKTNLITNFDSFKLDNVVTLCTNCKVNFSLNTRYILAPPDIVRKLNHLFSNNMLMSRLCHTFITYASPHLHKLLTNFPPLQICKILSEKANYNDIASCKFLILSIFESSIIDDLIIDQFSTVCNNLYDTFGLNIVQCNDLSTFPVISMNVKDKTIYLKPENYIERHNFHGFTYCTSLFKAQSPPNLELWTLGESFLRSYYTLFDYDTGTVKFAIGDNA